MKKMFWIIFGFIVIFNISYSQTGKPVEIHQKGTDLYMKGEYKKALETFSQIDTNSNYPGINYSLGLCSFGLNDYAAAEKYFLNELRKDSANVPAIYHIARCNKMLGRIKSSTFFYEKVLTLASGNRLIIFESAVLYYETKNYKRAIDLFLSIQDTNDASLNHYIGMSYFNLGNPDTAIIYFEKALKVNPGMVPSLNSIGRCYYIKKRYDDAILSFTKSLGIEYEAPLVHKNLGDCFYKINKNDEALISYKYALHNGDSSMNTLSNIAWAYYNTGRFDSTIKYLKIIVGNDPNDGNRRIELAGVLMKAKKYKEAEEEFQAGIGRVEKSLIGELAQAYVRYGITLHQNNKYKEAESKYRRSLELSLNELAYYNLGVVLEVEKKGKEAIKSYEKFLEIAKENNSLEEYIKEANDRLKLLKGR